MAKLPCPYVVEDCLGVMKLLSDGTVLRSTPPPFPAGADYDDGRVEWKDAVYDTRHNLGVRMYRPHNNKPDNKQQLPVLVYFHGGGFVFGSYSWPKNHAGCLRLAAELPAIVLSFDYRLAPEHRLPAAMDDAASALHWVAARISSGSADPWLPAETTQIFLGGQSSGATLAHHLLLLDKKKIKIKIAGYILLMPPFLSEKVTQSELDAPDAAFLSRAASDRYFRLMMPAGADKDHPLVNPFGAGSPSLDTAHVGRMLVVAAECDMVRDKDVEYAERLRAMGKDVELAVFAGQEHAFFATRPFSPAADDLLALIKRFLRA
ncbi:hypothetical protein BRADI_4g12370v3 [Brachypodium distachyon]|uniref:Alpha/beta hydrolase fold-3 domain-containing protein n=2 Tax=Brachypodium distachyon TaxID=15368 RepID=A0A0Q3L4N9_BRADI|nr:hypothetical protein BRADI_4g12370v3 [Brachypodium distachyon]